MVRKIESREEEERRRGRLLVPYPALYENKERLGARLREQLESIECPDGYGWLDLEKDEARLRELAEQRQSEGKLTPDDDAEEAYRMVRTAVYRRTPKHEAWCRLAKLEQARWEGGELTAAELSELDDLRARFPTAARGEQPTTIPGLLELERRRFYQTLTPAQAVELEELHRQYPKSAKKIRELVAMVRQHRAESYKV